MKKLIFCCLAGTLVTACSLAQWTQINIEGGPMDFLVAGQGGNIFAAGKGGIFKTSDNGTSYTFLSGFKPIDTSLAVIGLVKSQLSIFAQTHEGIMKSDDNGTTWVSVLGNLPMTNTNFRGLACPDGQTLWALASIGFGKIKLRASIKTMESVIASRILVVEKLQTKRRMAA